MVTDWSHGAVNRPRLAIDANPMQAKFEQSSALLLAGVLAGGGPYGKFDGSKADAKRVGVEVCSELIGDRYEDSRIDRSHGAWSEWFQAVVWDVTWLITDSGMPG